MKLSQWKQTENSFQPKPRNVREVSYINQNDIKKLIEKIHFTFVIIDVSFPPLHQRPCLHQKCCFVVTEPSTLAVLLSFVSHETCVHPSNFSKTQPTLIFFIVQLITDVGKLF